MRAGTSKTQNHIEIEIASLIARALNETLSV